MRLPLVLAVLSAPALWALPAWADLAVNCPAPSEADGRKLWPYDLLTDALKQRGFALTAWKVRDGNGVEMWATAHSWIVLEVSPLRCAWLVVDLAQEGDRLVSPPGADLADPRPMHPATAG